MENLNYSFSMSVKRNLTLLQVKQGHWRENEWKIAEEFVSI